MSADTWLCCRSRWHFERLINLFRFAVSVPSHRRIHSGMAVLWRGSYRIGNGSNCRSRPPLHRADLDIARENRKRIFSLYFPRQPGESASVPSRDAEGFSSATEKNGGALNEKRIPRIRTTLVRLWKIERGNGGGGGKEWTKDRKRRHDLSGTLIPVTIAPVEGNGYIRLATGTLLLS